jgi:hypothetical protein
MSLLSRKVRRVQPRLTCQAAEEAYHTMQPGCTQPAPAVLLRGLYRYIIDRMSSVVGSKKVAQEWATAGFYFKRFVLTMLAKLDVDWMLNAEGSIRPPAGVFLGLDRYMPETCELYDDHGILKPGSATAAPLLSSQWLLNDGGCVALCMGIPATMLFSERSSYLSCSVINCPSERSVQVNHDDPSGPAAS